MRRFWSDRRGNVAVLFAIAIVPIVGAIGAAVDYSLATAYRTDLQKALDATALALSKVLPIDDEVKRQEVGMQYFLANLGPNDLENIDLEIIPDNGKVRLVATGDYRLKIAGVFGATDFKIGASTEAVWGMGKVEVALVLDNSLSMGQGSGRIEALRAATVDLLKVLKTAARDPGDAKVGIVAFDGMVNTGYTQATAPSWVRWDWWDANAHNSDVNSRCKINGNNTNINLSSITPGKWLKKHCEDQSTTTSSCVGANGNNQSQCQSRGGKWVTTTHNGVWTPLPRNQWTGCVYDRDKSANYDVNDTDPTGNATYYPAAKCYSNPAVQAMTSLNYDWAALETKATALTPTGYTNITIGLAWGWHVLSKNGVFTEGAAYGTENLTKYIILMTDGDNTKSVSMEPRDCLTNAPANCSTTLDARTELVCANIKNAGIKIYSIRLISGNATLLQNCASLPTSQYYFDVQNTGSLASVFNAIGAEIASLHLAK